MVRGKKKEELTLEEKLEQALVPVEEQPYEVPKNWCWCKLSSICEYIKAGGDKPKKFSEEKTDVYNVPVIANGITNEGIIGYTDIAKESINTITISGRGTIGHSVIREYEYVPIVRLIVIKPNWCIIPKYLKYVFDYFIEEGIGSSIPQLTVPMLKNKAIPLPPSADQQRMVEQIESLFAKLDEVKEKVQEVIASIDDNVEALLYKAFTGQLTNDWRNSNIEIEKWEDTTLSEIVSGLKYGSSEKSAYEYKGTPILRIPNIGDGIIDFSDLKYMSEELKNSSHEVFEDDILIIRSNGSRDLVGKCALVPKLQERYAYASFLICVKVTEKVLPEYLVRFINSSMARAQMFDKAKSSSGIHNINSKELGAIKICVPSVKEQKQILICIQEFVNKEKRVQEISEEMLGSIDRMKKSILAKAFRGELGTNNPDEESAIELLKTILVKI